jgi:membrane protease subunit HflK
MPFFSLQNIRRYLPLRHDLWGRGSQDEGDSSGKGSGRKTPDEQPPDLDKLWKSFTDKLNQLFKKNGNAGGDGSEKNPKRDSNAAKGTLGAGVIIVLVLGVWLASGFFIVQEGQTGVVMTFGKFSHMTTSGFNWRWPYPIQSHELVNVSQVRTVEVGYRSTLKNKQPKEALMLTHDENIIDIQLAVQYRLKSASDWVFNNRDQEEMVRQVAETSIREVVGKSNMDFVLYEGRDKIAFDAQKLMQGIFDQYQSGVQITNVTMQGVQPPEQVQASFDDAVKAGQDRERQKNEGQAYANDVIPKARGAASRLLQEAEGYRGRIVANAEGDASRFKQVLSAYQKAPAVTRDRMYLETMQQIFANTTKMMVDAKSSSNMLYVPLDKLISQTAASPGGAASAAPPAETAAAPAPPAPARARESRERESR